MFLVKSLKNFAALSPGVVSKFPPKIPHFVVVTFEFEKSHQSGGLVSPSQLVLSGL